MVFGFDAVVRDFVGTRCSDVELPLLVDIHGVESWVECASLEDVATRFLEYLYLFDFDRAVGSSPGLITCLPEQFELFLSDCASDVPFVAEDDFDE